LLLDRRVVRVERRGVAEGFFDGRVGLDDFFVVIVIFVIVIFVIVVVFRFASGFPLRSALAPRDPATTAGASCLRVGRLARAPTLELLSSYRATTTVM
jgi:hypothetical protein